MELSQQKKMLEDSNVALKVLLEHREQDRVRLEENVLANVRKLVFPYLEKLRFQELVMHNRNIIVLIFTGSERSLPGEASILDCLRRDCPSFRQEAPVPFLSYACH